MKKFDDVLRSHLKLRHLQFLVVLDDLRHLSRTAEYLGMTQPAASKTLHEIENAFGIPLFARSTRGTYPTSFGETVLRFARNVMIDLERVRSELATYDGSEPPIKIGAMGLTIPMLLPRSLCRFKELSPYTTVSIEEGFLEALLPRLRVGEFDLILGRLEPRWLTPELQTESLYNESLSVVCSPDHHLAKRTDTSWEELVREPWVIPKAGSPAWIRFDLMLIDRELGFPVDIIETTSILAVECLLRERTCLGVLSNSIAQHMQTAGSLCILPVHMPAVLTPVGLFYIRDKTFSNGAETFIECLRQTAAMLQTPPVATRETRNKSNSACSAA